MATIAISKFKATCLAAMERVRRTGEPLRVTRFGKAIVDIVPPRAEAPRKRVLGGMASKMEIVGDVIETPPSRWDVLSR
jgi:antitoxin (DNA-binding transcriptional repressor) of toxin-antitoxin stability system